MAAALLYLPANRAFNSNGIGIPGATASLYTSGTTTPQNFYSNEALSVSLGSTITANAAGRFSPAYQDETVPFRLIVKDSAGVELDDIDPYYFGTLVGSVLGTEGAVCASRSEVAALVGQAGASAILTESGRAGSFAWDSSDLSDEVAADTAQGIYVPPTTDTTGASGAWVRRFSGPADFSWFGAVPDCTAAGSGTDHTAIFNAARAALIAAGKNWLHIPKGTYRFASSPSSIHDHIKITGDGWSQNPGTVGVTSYTGVAVYNGTILCFDSDIAGLKFIAFTDNASNATDFEFQSATGSIIRDIMLYSAGGTGTTANGIENYGVLFADNVRVEGFAGTGVYIFGDSGGTSAQYGNTALTVLKSVSCRFNKIHGFYVAGDNSSAISFLGCDAADNGGVGFLDVGPFGNFYGGCHASTNNASFGTPAGYSAAQRTKVTTDWAGLSDQQAGSFVCTGAAAQHVYSGCYSEVATGGKAEIIAPSVIVSGLLSADALHTASSTGLRFNGSRIKNLGKLYADNTGSVEVTEGFLDIVENKGYTGPSTGGRIQWNSSSGVALSGTGSLFDVGIRNAASASVLLVPHNSTEVQFPGSITVTGSAAAASVTLGGGTAISKVVVYTPSLTPSSVGAATVAEQTYTVSGLTTADKVVVNPPSIGNATGIAGARVSAADTLAIRWANPTAGALTPTAGTYTVIAFRS